MFRVQYQAKYNGVYRRCVLHVVSRYNVTFGQAFLLLARPRTLNTVRRWLAVEARDRLSDRSRWRVGNSVSLSGINSALGGADTWPCCELYCRGKGRVLAEGGHLSPNP